MESQIRKGDIYKYLRLNPPGKEVDSRWNLKALHQKQTREKLDIGKIFTSKRGGIFAKIRCAFQIITLKESSISNTLYILGVNLFSLFSA